MNTNLLKSLWNSISEGSILKNFQWSKRYIYFDKLLKSASHSISEGLILNFLAIRKVLYSVDLKYCDILLKLLSNSISAGLILKIFQGQAFKSHMHNYQQNSQNKICTLGMSVTYMQEPHIYNLLSAGLIMVNRCNHPKVVSTNFLLE